MSAMVLASAVPFAICAAIIALLGRSPWIARLADHPNHRSLHTRPTPRIGGLAIVLAAVPLGWILSGPSLQWIWALSLGLALVSFADDVRSLPVAVRLAAHFAAAALAVAACDALERMPWIFVPVAVLAIAWMTNLYNFMDGADGLAGGMAVIGFGAYAIAAADAGAMPLALASIALVSAALGFLLFNFPPARVFMGDAGSIPLGFLAGALGVRGIVDATWSSWFPLLVFSPFIVDATFTLLRRLARGERIWIAHRSHAYQRLVLSGWSTRQLALAAYGVMAAGAASAVVAARQEGALRWVIIGVWCVFYALAWVAIGRRNPPNSAP